MAHNRNTASEDQRLLEQETLIADATELVCELLQSAGVERQELARRLGKSKGHVTQLLSGERNMTLRTLSDLAHALGHRFELRYSPLTAPRVYLSTAGDGAVASAPRPVGNDLACARQGRLRFADRPPQLMPSLRSTRQSAGAAADPHEYHKLVS
jgi:transcriptional regulator with XRE-family HTH domain